MRKKSSSCRLEKDKRKKKTKNYKFSSRSNILKVFPITTMCSGVCRVWLTNTEKFGNLWKNYSTIFNSQLLKLMVYLEINLESARENVSCLIMSLRTFARWARYRASIYFFFRQCRLIKRNEPLSISMLFSVFFCLLSLSCDWFDPRTVVLLPLFFRWFTIDDDDASHPQIFIIKFTFNCLNNFPRCWCFQQYFATLPKFCWSQFCPNLTLQFSPLHNLMKSLMRELTE